MKQENAGIKQVYEKKRIPPHAGLNLDEWCKEKAEETEGQQDFDTEEG
nr:hypothetical protein [Planococcus antarcticus]